MNLYDRYLLPFLIDFACGIEPVQRQRAKLVPRAQGRVLEIGIGTGRNLPFYDHAKLEKLYGLDPALQMNRQNPLPMEKLLKLWTQWRRKFRRRLPNHTAFSPTS